MLTLKSFTFQLEDLEKFHNDILTHNFCCCKIEILTFYVKKSCEDFTWEKDVKKFYLKFPRLNQMQTIPDYPVFKLEFDTKYCENEIKTFASIPFSIEINTLFLKKVSIFYIF